MSENKPTIGIRPFGVTQKKNRSYDDELPRIPYMKMQQGFNEVRIVSGVGTYYHARWKGPKSKRSFGDRIRTSWPTYDDCPVKNDLGLEPKERYMFVVIDRADGELKLLDVGSLVLEQIEANLEVKNNHRKDGSKVSPRDFDISIKFDPKSKKPTNFYNVVAQDVCPMDQEDLDLISDIGGIEIINKLLEKQLICPKPETVKKRLVELGWDGKAVTKESENKSEDESVKEKSYAEPSSDDYSFEAPEND